MDKKTFISQMEDLVGFESVSIKPDQTSKIMDYIVSKIDDRAIINRFNNKGTEIIIAKNRKFSKPDVGFIVHTDVVSADPKMFKLRLIGDKIFGRGVSDMKFAIPIGISLLNKLIGNNIKVNFSLIFTSDEEIGGENGIKYLVTTKKINPKLVIVPDWGDNFVLTYKSKGVAMIEVKSKGKSVHASEIWNGKDANASLCRLGNSLLKIFDKNNKRSNWETTMNIGYLHGGDASNKVCDMSTMKIDFRFPETVSAKRIYKLVKSKALKIDRSLRVDLMVSGDPTYNNPNSKILTFFRNQAKKVLGKSIKMSGGNGATDARHFAKLKTPMIVIKPNGGGIHSDSEWISVSSCITYHDLMYTFIQKLPLI